MASINSPVKGASIPLLARGSVRWDREGIFATAIQRPPQHSRSPGTKEAKGPGQ